MNTTNLLLIMQWLDNIYNDNKEHGIFLKYDINSSIENSKVTSCRISLKKIYNQHFYKGPQFCTKYTEIVYNDEKLTVYFKFSSERDDDSYYFEEHKSYKEDSQTTQQIVKNALHTFYYSESEVKA